MSQFLQPYIRIKCLLPFLALLSFSAVGNENFSGKWQGESGTSSTFTLVLKQNAQTLTGSYCYITQHGNRIDCPEQDEDNLHGSVKGNRAHIVFDSSFGGINGQATLILQDGMMTWQLEKEPVKGEYYAPESYTLSRQG